MRSQASIGHFLFSSFLLILGLAPSTSLAESHVSVSISPQVGTIHDVFNLSVRVSGEDAQDTEEPRFENSNEFKLESAGKSTQHAFQFGPMTASTFSVTYSFQVYPDSGLKPGQYELPPGKIHIGGEDYRLKQPIIEIVGERAASRSPEGGEFSQFVDKEDPYVGEQITYRAVITLRHNATVSLSDMDWKGFWHESFGEQGQRERNLGRVTVTAFLEALFPLASGETILPERRLEAELSVPAQSRTPFDDPIFDGFWNMQRTQKVRKLYSARPILVKAKELPPPPAGTKGATPVGTVSLQTEVDRTDVEAGENLTLTVVVSGDANLRSFNLPQPEGTNVEDFRFYFDEPKLELSVRGDRIWFVKTFKAALVPLRAGTLQLPRFTVTTFDPKEEQYRSLKTTQKLLNVSPARSTEKLIVHAPDIASPSLPVESPKEEVAVLAEDLLPQHVGPEALTTTHGPGRLLVILVLLGAPIMAVFLHLTLVRSLLLLGDPKALASRRAGEKASLALSELEARDADDFATALHETVRTYLGERFRTQGESLTARDAGDLLREHLTSDKGGDLPSRLEDYLGRLQRHRFGGTLKPLDKEHGTDLLEEARKLIEEVERAC